MHHKKRPNPSPAIPLEEIDSERERIPASSVRLTPEERRILKDPDWIDEDEADAIVSMRIEREEDVIPFEQYLKSRGRKLEN